MSIAINFTQNDSGFPIWVKLLGAGILATRNDCGPYVVSNPRSVIALTRNEMVGGAIPIDVEHSIDTGALIGGESPAAGWITDFRIGSDGEILGLVSWTTLGKSALSRGLNGKPAYSFLSPVIEYDTETREVRAILRAGLTNTPNLPDMAIARNSSSRGKMSTAEKIALLRAEMSNSPRSETGMTAAEKEVTRRFRHVSDSAFAASASQRRARETESGEAVKIEPFIMSKLPPVRFVNE
jgi:phage I-like protein